MRRVCVHNKKLRTCAVGHHRTRHRKYASFVFQGVFESVFVEFSPYGIPRTSRSVTFRISALNHESLDYAVEAKPVVKSFVYERNKVIDRVRRVFGIEFGVKSLSAFHFESYYRVIAHCIRLRQFYRVYKLIV